MPVNEQQPFRLDQGGLIDREAPLQFRFNGKSMSGFEGDSLASALLANGVKVLARSFKYHRPRGIYSSGEEEPCAFVEVGTGNARIPTCRAPCVPLKQGLVARSQTGWPSVNFDAGRILDFTHALWPAGFYNKTFKWPSWHAWEGMIRGTAGLGRPLTDPDPDRYENVNFHCDVLICGAGPAGLLAALALGRSGLETLLVDQDRSFGGSFLGDQIELDGRPGLKWVQRVTQELEGLANVTLLPHTTATGVYDHLVTTLLQEGDGGGWRETYWTVRPRRILLATGAIEQGLIFPDNDRPGVMLAGAVRDYLNRYAVVPGQEVIVATNNDSAYQTALDLANADVDVAGVIDTRPKVNKTLRQRLADEGIAHWSGAGVRDTRGGGGVRRLKIQTADGTSSWRRCDLLAVSGGWAPRLQLLAQAGGGLRFEQKTHNFLPGETPRGVHLCGSAAGAAGLADVFSAAQKAAREICGSLDRPCPDISAPEVTSDMVSSDSTGWTAPQPSRSRQWIDLAHDVTTHDAELAVREGFDSVEHFKRYTTAGMSVDQGKTSNTNAHLVLSALTGRDPGQTGTTTFRPPYRPVTLGAVAAQRTGEFYAPRRYLPAHAEHETLGAHFEDYGWQRPECYPRLGESVDEAISREARAVRSGVGVFDNSPIGKLEVCGPDAATFLDRLYINDVLSLKPGKVRYGLMLNENGTIIDDGVFVRVATDHFVVHTTSGNVQRVREMMEEWLQCEWTDLRVVVHDATVQYANLTVAGPRSRDVVEALDCEIDISAAAFPHMAFATGRIAGLDARLTRVSYSGEVSFELNVAASHGTGMLRAILDKGAPFGIVPFGVEALMVLRTEKGYLHVGTDTDGSSSPDDVGWGRVASRKNRDFLGGRSLARPADREGGRRQLVGLETLERGTAMDAGGHLLLGEGREPPAETDGWITSACYSPNLERYIALAMLRDGRAHHGEIVTVCDEERRYAARVVSPHFYDPENEKLS